MSSDYKSKIYFYRNALDHYNQQDRLLSFACDYLQGYLYAKPMRALDFLDHVK